MAGLVMVTMETDRAADTLTGTRRVLVKTEPEQFSTNHLQFYYMIVYYI